MEKVKNTHKASRRAMEGETEPKPKKSFGSKRYKKTQPETKLVEDKENIDSNIEY